MNEKLMLMILQYIKHFSKLIVEFRRGCKLFQKFPANTFILYNEPGPLRIIEACLQLQMHFLLVRTSLFSSVSSLDLGPDPQILQFLAPSTFCFMKNRTSFSASNNHILTNFQLSSNFSHAIATFCQVYNIVLNDH